MPDGISLTEKYGVGGDGPIKMTPLEVGGYTQDPYGQIYYYGSPAQPGAYESALSAQQWQQQNEALRLRSTPTSSFSSSASVSQSLLDPASIALQQEEQRLKEIELQRQAARDNVLDAFARDKFRQEMELGNRAEARQTQALQEQIAARQQSTQLSLIQLKNERATTQARLQFEAAQANARASMEAEQINESRRQANLEQRRGVANDIAGFARDPGDKGAQAAYLLAGGVNAPTGALSTAIAQGQDFRTPESLVPLDLLLANRDELAQGPKLFTPQFVSVPSLPEMDLSGLAVGYNPNIPVGMPGGPQFANGSGMLSGYDPGQSGGGIYSGPGGGGIQAALDSFAAQGAAANASLNASNAEGLAEGGMTTDTMFKGNEQGAELFFNPTGAPIAVIDAQTTKKLTKGKKVKGHAEGTLELGEKPAQQPQNLTSLFYGGNQPTTIGSGRSLDFLNQALGIARYRTPWARGMLPTPVGVSAPGTSAFIQGMGSSLASLGAGVNPGLFLEEARMAAPVGLSGAPTRRSR